MIYAPPPQPPVTEQICGGDTCVSNPLTMLATFTPKLPPLPPEARKDTLTFCAGIMFAMDVTHPGWRAPWESDWAHAPKEVPDPVSLTIDASDALLVCRQDGTFSIREPKP